MNLQGFYTNKGRDLAAKIAAGTAEMTVNRVVAGSGHTADIPSATAFSMEVQTLHTGLPAVSGYTATLPVTLPEAETAASYQLTELGVYANDPDIGVILFQVYQLDAAEAITAHGEGVLRFYLHQSIGAEGVSVTCSPSGVVLEEDIAELRARDAYADHRNLLDNGWFTVNQREWTSGDSPAETYTLDRWKTTAGTLHITVNQDHSVTVVNNSEAEAFFGQWIDTLVAGTYTCSVKATEVSGQISVYVMESGGTPERLTEFYVSDGISSGSGAVSIDRRMVVLFMLNPGDRLTIKAVKLEVGTVSTLANDVPPNYAEELAKCQRYFQYIPMTIYHNFGIGFVKASQNSALINLPLPVTMRVDPAATADNIENIRITTFDSGSIDPETIRLYCMDGSNVTIEFENWTSFFSNDGFCWLAPSGDAAISLSADL